MLLHGHQRDCVPHSEVIRAIRMEGISYLPRGLWRHPPSPSTSSSFTSAASSSGYGLTNIPRYSKSAHRLIRNTETGVSQGVPGEGEGSQCCAGNALAV